MLSHVKLAAFVAAVLAILVAGCNNGKKSASPSAPAATTTAQAQKVPPTQHFFSRPDLKPPLVRVQTAAHGTAPGYLFLAPKMVVAQAGPLIMDNRGEVVWFSPLNTKGVTDFRKQMYEGKPVLTWWRGHVSNAGVGDGWYVIYDTSYRPIAEVRPGHGLVGDVHEFLITRTNTAVPMIHGEIHRRPCSHCGREVRRFMPLPSHAASAAPPPCRSTAALAPAPPPAPPSARPRPRPTRTPC